jgi:hypothetical protein
MSTTPTIGGVLDRLARCQVQPDPFPHFVLDGFLPDADASAVLAWLERQARWLVQERSFYVQYSCTNADDLRSGPLAGLCSAASLNALAAGLGDLFDVELEAANVHVEAHRLDPGQGIGVHNDNPRFGTESVRVVLHFGRVFNNDDGGHLVLLSEPDPAAVCAVICPLHNSAAGFFLSERSYHAVSDVRSGVRYSVVLGFYEKGRAPLDVRIEFGDVLSGRGALLAEPGVQSMLAAAERAGAVDVDHGRGSLLDHFVDVASVLHRWGCPPRVWRAGLFHSIYGTVSVEGLMRRDRRSTLRALIGDEAENLVWLYATLSFGPATRNGSDDAWIVSRRDSGQEVLTGRDVVDLNLLAWANRMAQEPTVELPLSDLLDLDAVIAKLEDDLPEGARRDLAPIRHAALPWVG